MLRLHRAGIRKCCNKINRDLEKQMHPLMQLVQHMQTQPMHSCLIRQPLSAMVPG